MKKRVFISFIMALLFISTSIMPAFAGKNNSITVKIEGKTLELGALQPILDSDYKIRLPLRSIAEALGAKVYWDNKTKMIKIISDNSVAKIGLLDCSVQIEEDQKKTGQDIATKNGSVFIPLQLVSEIFKTTVDWDEETRTASIVKEKESNYIFKNQPPLTESQKELSTKLTDYLSSLEKDNNFHGAVLVAKDGKILVDKAYGMANYEQGIKNKKSTIFPICSMTKQFTAMAIMQLQEKGLLNVNDKLSKYIPDFKRGNEITLHQLLTHTSGIYSNHSLGGGLDDIINEIKTKDLVFNPGENSEYCNTGYVLLQYIIEKLSGISYDKYLKKNIFEPLGMKNSGICYSDGVKNYQATGYYGFLDVYPSRDEYTIRNVFGSGNICSTVEDLYLWDRALYTEKLVSKKTMDTIFTKHSFVIDNDYGYGWDVIDGEYGKVVAHGGDFMGYTTNIKRYLDKDTVIITLTNNFPIMYNRKYVHETLEDIVFGKSYKMPEKYKTTEVDPAIYKNYIGSYETQDGNIIQIDEQGGNLYLNLKNVLVGFHGQLYPLSKENYLLKENCGTVTFKKDAAGNVTGLTLKEFNAVIDAQKTSSEPSTNRKSVKVDTRVYDDYLGEYDIEGTGMTIIISKVNNHLYAQEVKFAQQRSEIFPESETKYFDLVNNAQIEFVRNKNGSVDRLKINLGSGFIPAKKIK